MIHADDTLQSVLGRLSLSKHIHLFQVYIQVHIRNVTSILFCV